MLIPSPFMAKPCRERSEPTSAEGAASEGAGSGIPARIRGDRIAGQFLAAGENLALRKLRFSFLPSTTLLPDIVFGSTVLTSGRSGEAATACFRRIDARQETELYLSRSHL